MTSDSVLSIRLKNTIPVTEHHDDHDDTDGRHREVGALPCPSSAQRNPSITPTIGLRP